MFDSVNFEEYAKLCKLRDQVGDYWKMAPGDTDDSGCKVLYVYEHIDAFLDCFDELKEEAGILLSAACTEEALISFRKICSQVSEGASI